MSLLIKARSWPIGLLSVALSAAACGTVAEKPAPSAVAPLPAPPTPAVAPARKIKAVEVEGVISAVGQRTITFQLDKKGKVREEVVGVDEKTKIEKGGSQVKLRDLQVADLALINYQPEAYTPAISIKVTGKGKVQKVGGGD